MQERGLDVSAHHLRVGVQEESSGLGSPEKKEDHKARPEGAWG